MKPAQPLPEKLEATNEQIRAEDFVFRLDATQCGSAAWDFPALAAEIAKRYNAHAELMAMLEGIVAYNSEHEFGEGYCGAERDSDEPWRHRKSCTYHKASALLAKIRGGA